MVYIRHASETDTIFKMLKNYISDENIFLIARNPIQANRDLLRKPIQIASETVARKTTF